MDKLETIRYMGNKTALLDYIVPAISKVTPPNGCVLDIMAGSNVVAYALKRKYKVYTNDVQAYSHSISLATIVNQTCTISANTAMVDLIQNYELNKSEMIYSFFTQVYSNTYFSEKQCIEIDSIRYAIEKINLQETKNLYLFALMGAMCKVQSTPGHFAQYMPSTHTRIIPLQNMNIFDEFMKKCDQYQKIVFNDFKNKAYCEDYKILLKNPIIIEDVDTIYLDSPYSQEQYSRFYHVLETIVKYDCPSVNFKAKYREGRFHSDFCYKNKVKNEFEYIISFCQKNDINLVISYSNKALFPINELKNICEIYFEHVEIEAVNYKHSTQGKGTNSLKEVIISCF